MKKINQYELLKKSDHTHVNELYFVRKAHAQRLEKRIADCIIIARGHDMLGIRFCDDDLEAHGYHNVAQALAFEQNFRERDLTGANIYTTDPITCLECLEMAKEVGIKRVYYGFSDVYYLDAPFYKEIVHHTIEVNNTGDHPDAVCINIKFNKGEKEIKNE